jgi:hypothetical protein
MLCQAHLQIARRGSGNRHFFSSIKRKEYIMPGFALLPTLDAPVSHMTLRLSADDMAERNEWIVGANARGMDIKEIAYEVGLSVPRVYQILKPSPSQRKKKARIINRKFKTPRDAALAEFWRERAHPACRDHGACNDCFGMSMIIDSEYNADGWPYDWATDGQEKFIAACS